MIWRPRLRPSCWPWPSLLHVGIGACLGMWTFGLIMLVGCASFLPTEGVANFVASLAPLRSRSRLARSPFFAGPQPAVSWSDRAQLHDREPALMADTHRARIVPRRYGPCREITARIVTLPSRPSFLTRGTQPSLGPPLAFVYSRT